MDITNLSLFCEINDDRFSSCLKYTEHCINTDYPLFRGTGRGSNFGF